MKKNKYPPSPSQREGVGASKHSYSIFHEYAGPGRRPYGWGYLQADTETPPYRRVRRYISSIDNPTNSME